MSQLVVEVSKDARIAKISERFLCVSVILAMTVVFGRGMIAKSSLGWIDYVLFFVLIVLFQSIFSAFIKVTDAPEAIVTIDNAGIRVTYFNRDTRNYTWPEIVCVNVLGLGTEDEVLRIAPKNEPFRGIEYRTSYLSHPQDEIMMFIHKVCPYGPDISFWNERR